MLAHYLTVRHKHRQGTRKPPPRRPPGRVGRGVSHYSGLRTPDGATVVTRPDGSPLPLAPSLALRNHSPTGFEWGYLGSGPAQLALALLLDHASGDVARATAHYQDFKEQIVSTWRGKVWALDRAELAAWLEEAESRRRLGRCGGPPGARGEPWLQHGRRVRTG